MPVTLPEINVWDMTADEIALSWRAANRSDTKSYKLYGSATYNGTYNLIQEAIPNRAHALTPGSVLVRLKRSDLGIAADAPFYFKISSVDFSDVESSQGNLASVDAFAIYRARVQDDRNPVYKNFVLSIPTGTTNQLVDVKRVLGREADFIQITSDVEIQVRFNSSANDVRKVTSAVPFTSASNGTIVVTSVYVSNASGSTANVQIFVSGN